MTLKWRKNKMSISILWMTFVRWKKCWKKRSSCLVVDAKIIVSVILNAFSILCFVVFKCSCLVGYTYIFTFFINWNHISVKNTKFRKKWNSLKLQLGMLQDLQIMGTYNPIRSSLIYIYIHMSAIAGQTTEPNWLNIFEGIHGYPGIKKNIFSFN